MCHFNELGIGWGCVWKMLSWRNDDRQNDWSENMHSYSYLLCKYAMAQGQIKMHFFTRGPISEKWSLPYPVLAELAQPPARRPAGGPEVGASCWRDEGWGLSKHDPVGQMKCSVADVTEKECGWHYIRLPLISQSYGPGTHIQLGELWEYLPR